jgi:putative protein kinase ArgK-like GTPase of G3E family
VVVTSARSGRGLEELAAAAARHRGHLEAGGLGGRLRASRAARRIVRALAELMVERASGGGAGSKPLAELAAEVAAGRLSELEAAGRLLSRSGPRS